MTAHDVLRASDAWSAWEAERVDLAARRERLAEQIAEVNAAEAKAIADHAAKVAGATRGGKSIPKPPVPAERAHLDHALSVQTADEMAHRARRDQVFAEAASGGAMDALTARERDRQARLTDLAPIVAEIVAEAHADARLCRDLVAALDRWSGRTVRPPRSDRIDPHPDLSTLLAAALNSASLLVPQPLTPQTDGVTVDRDRVHQFGYADRDRPAPPPTPRALGLRARL